MTRKHYDSRLGSIDSCVLLDVTFKPTSMHATLEVHPLLECLPNSDTSSRKISSAKQSSSARAVRSTSHGNGATARGVGRN